APLRDEKATTTGLRRSFLRYPQYAPVKDKFSATKGDLYAYAARYVLTDHWPGTRQFFRKQTAATPGKTFTWDALP
ncbi:MAG: hypothetical protein WA003_14110, partial [Desulfuromonadaceae bacterium]